MMPDVALKHPRYTERWPYWQEAWDFYRGGRHVTDPGRSVLGFNRFWFPTSYESISSSEPEPTRKRSRFELVPVQSYLYSHVRESRRSHEDRSARACHVPIFRHIVDIYVSAALRTEPGGRNIAGAIEPWATYWNNVDFRGTGIAAFIRQATAHALACGYWFAFTDKPRFSDAVPSRAHQLARGERAYSYLVSPLDVVNWSLDEHGGFRWVVVREDQPDNRLVGDGVSDTPLEQYRVWYPDGWELYRPDTSRQQSTNWIRVDGDAHPVGEVPVAVLHARQGYESRQTLDADSMLADLVRIDRDIYNAMSLLNDQIYKQGFSQLCMPASSTGEGPYSLDVGLDTALIFDAQNGSPLYLTPDAAVIRQQWEIVAAKAQMAREFAGVGRGRSEYSKEERSGDALMVESRNENNRIASLISEIEEFDRKLHQHVAAWEGTSDAPVASYTRDVSLSSVDAQIGRALSLLQLGVPDGAMAEIKKPLVERSMNELGLPREAVGRALAAFDEPPKPVAPPVAGADEEAEASEEAEDDEPVTLGE